MKVLFICSSLEEGKDGIGDYTRKISIECRAAYGISPVIVAFNDKYISRIELGNIDDIPFYRLPSNFSLKKREDELKSIIKSYIPIDWVSLQFVSYGLDNKGIVRAETRSFYRSLGDLKIQVMMHELWVAEERGTSLKMKVLGQIQKRFILKFLKIINPEIVQTSIPLYQKMLQLSGIKTSVLPLFSNINHHTNKPENFDSVIPGLILNKRDDYIIGCLFGSIYHNSWDVGSLFLALEKLGQTSHKRIMIVSIGRISYGKKFWETLPQKYKDIEFVTLGQQNEGFISYWLSHFVNFGIITSPILISGKSGSYMAFLQHGVPVFGKKNDLSFKFNVTEDMIDSKIIQENEEFKFEILPNVAPEPMIRNTARIFLKTLSEFE
jgi:hypothetical protein